MRRAALGLALSLVVLPHATVAEEASKTAKSELLLPPWSIAGGLTGQYVDVTGSGTKFLEDYNLQDGAGGTLTASRSWSDDRSLHIDAAGQTPEEQGYFIGNYRRLSHYSLLVDVNALQRFYNARTGMAPVTTYYPFTNDSRVFFGEDDPSTHWITPGATLDYQPKVLFHDTYLNFSYQSVQGQQTLLKGGTVDDPNANADGAGGPGTVAFDFPGRKQVDYQTFQGFTGGRSGLGGVNWQTDGSYENSGVKSTVNEVNFGNNLATTEVDRFQQNSRVQVGKYDLVGSRYLRPNLYVYTGYIFTIEENDPTPDQVVTPSAALPVNVTTRSTTNGNVQRIRNALGMGLLYRPFPRMVFTADTRASGSVLSGSITEDRNEQLFLTGNVGTIDNDSHRSVVDTTTRLATQWAALPRTLIRGTVVYTYRHADTDSTRNANFVQVRAPEIQDYGNSYNRVLASPKARWSGGHGRAVEVGYSFLFEDVDTSVDQISNEYIMNSYQRRRHNPYLKATARLRKNLRGELRFEYVRESRQLKAPIVEPIRFTLADGGTTVWETFRVMPSATYQPDPHWSLFGAFSIGQDQLTIKNLGMVPSTFGQFNDFQYDALTETVACAIGYAPSEKWSVSPSYNYVHNGHRSVGNQIHRLDISARYRVAKNWDVRAGYRYLRYDQDSYSVDDYRANIPFVGVSGRF